MSLVYQAHGNTETSPAAGPRTPVRRCSVALRFRGSVATQKIVQERPLRRLVALLSLVLVSVASGCATQVSVPRAPRFPEVRFIPPEDPDAVIALSADGELSLVERDRLMRERIRLLEDLLAKH
jgi:hypothetical protein